MEDSSIRTRGRLFLKVWIVSTALHVSAIVLTGLALDVLPEHLFAMLAGGALGSLVLAAWVSRQFSRESDPMVKAAQQWVRGDLKSRIEITSGSAAPAAHAFNEMAEAVQARIGKLEVELDGLKAILQAMEEGLLVVDSQSRIVIANPAARKMLGIESDIAGQLLRDVTQQQDLLSNIDRSVRANQTCTFEFHKASPASAGKAPAAGTRRQILTRCSPFLNMNQTMRGAVAVMHDITELRRLERMRTEFVANVSHELRTPLTSLLGYLETLHDGGLEDGDEARRFIEVCRRQAERLSHIVDDLLRLSRLENPQQDIAATEINLTEVVNSAVDSCTAVAQARGIRVETQTPGWGAPIWGDRGLLVQALCNLIENAIHYNRENGKVTVSLQPADSTHWELSVADTGIGIPQESLGRIFERFYRVDKARSREKGGTGLGLSIVRHIALAHGATVRVESELNKGSTFILRFKGLEKSRNTVSGVA